MNQPHSAGGIIVNLINGEPNILLANQTEPSDGNKEYWSFPKGHLEDGEDTITAAYREIYEETNLEESDLLLVSKIGEFERKSVRPYGASITKKVTFYHFKTKQIEVKSNDKDNLEPAWFPINDVPEKLGNKVDAEFFEDIKQRLISNS